MKKNKFAQSDFKTSTICWPPEPRCVMVAHKDGIIAVADSKNPKQKPLQFDKNEWNAFVTGVKNGEFDH